MDIKTTSSKLVSSLAVLMLGFFLSANVFAEDVQDLMLGKMSSDVQEETTEPLAEPVAEPAPVAKVGDKKEAAPKKEEKPKAVSTKDLTIPQDELKLLLKPFMTDELKIEADAWLKALKEKATEVTDSELETVRLNKKQAKIAEGLELLEPPASDTKSKEESPVDEDDPRNLNEADRLKYVKKSLLEADPSINADALDSKGSVKKLLKGLNTDLDKKKEVLADVTSKLIEQRSSLVDRLNIVLDNINSTDGIKEDGTDNDLVVPIRRYISTVTGLHVDTKDAKSFVTTIKKWLFSKKGGQRWLKNIALFIGILFGFWILSRILAAIANKMLRLSGNSSELLHNFVVGLVKKVVMLVGVIMSLSALEVNVSPILAALGALGFILAFALQGTISNFASGLLMLVYRPFDIGDSIEGGGVKGIVESMSLVSTYIKTPDNQHIVVPNNAIWGGAITNSSSASTRRIDLNFTVSHEDNADKVIKLLEKIVKGQSLVLAEPASSVGLDELGETGMNFSVQPWVKKEDYGTVKSAITREVKRLFDNKEINMPS